MRCGTARVSKRTGAARVSKRTTRPSHAARIRLFALPQPRRYASSVSRRSDQEVVHLLHERQRNPGKSIPLEEVEARIQKRIDADAKAKPAARRGPRAAPAPRRARRAR